LEQVPAQAAARRQLQAQLCHQMHSSRQLLSEPTWAAVEVVLVALINKKVQQAVQV